MKRECPKCRMRLGADDKFCGNCGKRHLTDVEQEVIRNAQICSVPSKAWNVQTELCSQGWS